MRGKGNPESFNSCSHGDGRTMSRTEAKRRYSVEDQFKASEGVECRKDAAVIDAVMQAQSDLVDVAHTLKQVVCVKGWAAPAIYWRTDP